MSFDGVSRTDWAPWRALASIRSPAFEGELIVFGDGRAIVKGTEGAERARSFDTRTIGA